MSNDAESDADLGDLLNTPPNHGMTWEELLVITTIDLRRKKRITMKLHDKNGDEVELADIIDNLSEYLHDQTKQENSSLVTNTWPLLSQCVALSMKELSGGDMWRATLMLGSTYMRRNLVWEMVLGFYLLKFIQKNELQMTPIEEDISEEEVDRILKIDKANEIAAQGMMLGWSANQIAEEIVSRNIMSEEELEKEMGYKLKKNPKKDNGN